MAIFMKNIKNLIYKGLRKSEHYTKTDMIVLVKEGSWLSFGKIIGMIATLGLTYVLANFLSQEDYGQYKFVLSAFGIITAFSLTGLGTSLVQSIAKGFEGTFFEAIKVHLKWSMVMTVIAIVVAIYYFLTGNNLLGISMLLVAIAAPVMQTYTMYSSYLQGKRNFRDDSWFGFWYNMVPAIAIILATLIFNSFVIVLATYFISYSLITLYIHNKVKKTIDTNSPIDPESIPYGKHLSLMNVLGGISSNIDKILIFHYLGPVELAIYTIALAIPQQLRTLDRLINSLSATRLPILSIQQIKKVLPRKSLFLFLASLFITIIYIVIAPIFFKIFFPNYLEAVFYSQVYVLIMLFSPTTLLRQTLTAHTRTKELYIMQTAMPIIKIVGLFILLPPFGIMGAIGAIFLSEITRLIMILYFYKKLN